MPQLRCAGDTCNSGERRSRCRDVGPRIQYPESWETAHEARIFSRVPDHAERRGAGLADRAVRRRSRCHALGLVAASAAPPQMFFVLGCGACRSCLAGSACSPRSSTSGIPSAHGVRSRCGARRGSRANVWRCRCSSRCAFAYGVAHWFGSPWSLAIGALGVLASGALFVCTAMIYACLRFLQEWATPLTIVNFVLLGCASGFTLATACAAWFAPSLTCGACRLRVRADARGLREPRRFARAQCAACGRSRRCKARLASRGRSVVQKSRGFTAGAFNLREFFHGQTPRTLRRIKWTFLVAAFARAVRADGAGRQRVVGRAVDRAAVCAACVRNTRDSSRNAGSSSPRRGIRRTCITRARREGLNRRVERAA